MFSSPSSFNISDYAQQHRDLLQTYCQLSVQPRLSESDSVRLDSILANAETNPLISFLLDEADHMLAHLHHLIDDSDISEQQQKLQTCLDDAWLNQAFQDLAYRLQTSQCKSLQQYLKERGFYRDAIDGVMGPITKAAMQAYCEQLGELPQPFPINTPDPVS